MFERYDEPAQRTMFFARFEASRLGIASIETEHILLGLMRDLRGHAARLLRTLPLAEIRTELERNRGAVEVPTSVEIPFSAETKRVLHHATDEADALTQRYISTEHLLLGLLREPESRAGATLARFGMQLTGAREQVRESYAAAASLSLGSRSAVQAHLERIIESTRQLHVSLSGDPDVSLQVIMLLRDLQTLKSLLDEQR